MLRSSSSWTSGGDPRSPPGLPQSKGGNGRPDVLRDARVLVVEDEFLVAALLEDRLAELGCDVVGPAATIAEALELLATEPLDAAVLDVNINGEQVFPVADALAERGIPFLFATAYGASGLTDRHHGRTVLDKPYQERALEQALRGVLIVGKAN